MNQCDCIVVGVDRESLSVLITVFVATINCGMDDDAVNCDKDGPYCIRCQQAKGKGQTAYVIKEN